MTILHPYEHSNPIDSLSRFVLYSLLEVGISSEYHGEFIKVDIDDLHKDFFEVPSSGSYLLQFSRTPSSEQKVAFLGNFQVIHITNNHPLIKNLIAGIDYSAVQSAEFRNENEPKFNFENWISHSFKDQNLYVKIDTKRNSRSLKVAEFWFELVSKSGRGMFPIILEKKDQIPEKWAWSEYFQKSHIKFRGLLTSENVSEIFLEMENNNLGNEVLSKNFELNLKKGIEIAKNKVTEIFNQNILSDGAFLRRLRQLRQAEMRLSLARKNYESNTIINHLEQMVKSIKDEIRLQNEVKLNSIVLLFSTSEIEKEISVFNKEKNEIVSKIKLYWDTKHQDHLYIDYNLGNIFDIRILKGTPIDSLPLIKVCSNCNKLTYFSEIKNIEIGEGVDCNLCRLTCVICNKSLDKLNVVNDEHDNINATLCLTHSKYCEFDEIITSIRSLLLLGDQKKVHFAHCEKCFICDLEGSRYRYHVKDNLVKHSLDNSQLLCKEHAVTCEFSNQIVNITEILILKSNMKVYKVFAEECFECKRLKDFNCFHLKKDLKNHYYKENYSLCKDHAFICEISGNTVSKSEIVELETHQKVAIQITSICIECSMINEEFVYHLTSSVRNHSFNSNILCNHHAFICDLTSSVVVKNELEIISDGRHVLKNLTDICNSCADIPDRIKYHLKNDLYSNGPKILPDILSCEEHSFHCWFCNEKRPIKGSVEATSLLTRICLHCHTKVQNEELSSFKDCSLCKNLFINKNIIQGQKKVNCPRCKQKTLNLDKIQNNSTNGFDLLKIKTLINNSNKNNIYNSITKKNLFLITNKKHFWSKIDWWVFDNQYNLIWTVNKEINT
jgi:hypothetical protein